MKLIVDTHIWSFMAHRPKRLGRRTTSLLLNPKSEIWLSPLSVWEVLLLHRLGRFGKFGDPHIWIKKSMAAWPFREAAVTYAIAQEAGNFELKTNDPIDRLIVATARVLKCTLITEDRAIIQSGCVETIAND
jgi:PIN domain nuclease of toxin-antitoxin system